MSIYKSASLLFFDKEKGYLICQEMRDNKLLYHPIGGKYESKDNNIGETSIREFVEETMIYKNEKFQNLLPKKHYRVHISPECQEEYVMKDSIEYMYEKVFESENIEYMDYVVNEKNNYVHRFYVVEMDGMEEEIRNIIKDMDKNYEKSGKIEKLEWDKKIGKSKKVDINVYSRLMVLFNNSLRKKEYIKEKVDKGI